MRKLPLVSALTLAGLGVGVHAAPTFDLGSFVQHQLFAKSRQLFGIVQPVASSSTESVDAATAEADPASLVTVAKGLSVSVVTAAPNAGPNIDMMAPWPDAVTPTHLIACNEQDPEDPGVQRIRLSDGQVETILIGTDSCDPVRVTAWGTIIVGEEAGNSGWLIEIADPLATTGVTFDRNTGISSDPAHVVARPAVGRLSWEGIALYDSGVMYYGDENRPFQGTPGGAYFKFVPDNPWTGGAPITDLSQSPLVSGSVYGLRLGLRSGGTDYGQGSNTGLGTWISIPGSNVDLRAAAAANDLTGYYRPEDADVDQAAEAVGEVRFCGNNTGNEGTDQNYGETICVTDGTLDEAVGNTATPEVQYLVVGYPDFAMMDNIAYQPGRGNWLIQEDGDGPDVGRNNDIFSCLDDGPDDNLLSDGCIRVLTVNDLEAETTGGIFDATGKRYWVSVQHNVTGHGVVLELTGWK
jgi:hypothetical protein